MPNPGWKKGEGGREVGREKKGGGGNGDCGKKKNSSPIWKRG